MKRKLVAALAGVASLALIAPTSAFAGEPQAEPPLAEGLAGPLQFAVQAGPDVPGRKIYVGQSFAGLLSQVGVAVPLATEPGGEVAGVDVAPDGTVYFVTTGPSGALLQKLSPGGAQSVVADLGAYETANNPDGGVTYGFAGIDDECLDLLPVIPDQPPWVYTGIVESHPYAVAVAHGKVYVADAAGNTILEVTPRGAIRTAALMPVQPLVVTAEMAAGLGLPDCVVDHTYNFEPVPTDIELGTDGKLYVTTLPGGPEEPGFPARGGVWRVNAFTGHKSQLAGGIAGATNLAIGKGGTIYVTELFGNRVSKVSGGGVVPVLDLPSPAAVEYARGYLYVAYDVFGNGSVARIAWS
jgi:hypothetical protein